MQASETKLQVLLEGVKQFVIPLFQRSYTWGDRNEWKVLWEDMIELYEQDEPKPHFIGSIVNMPTVSVPEGVAKYLVIDGQQRLTTIFVILLIIRDKHKHHSTIDLFNELNETFLVNKYKKDLDYYKLLPTHKFNDRDSFFSIVNENSTSNDNKILKAYTFFERKIKQHPDINLQRLTKIITNYLSVVSITLDPNDNPYLVFESLNAKGTPLNSADLIRNYFFMRIHVDNQESVYKQYWEPIEQRLGTDLTEFIRHYLMKGGNIVNKSDVYFTLKDKVGINNALEFLEDLNKFSIFYSKLLNPEKEKNNLISFQLSRFNRIEVTTSYPLILNLYDWYNSGKIEISEFLQMLKYLENYLIRRFISGKPTRELNKIFPSIIKNLATTDNGILESFKNLLAIKGYPKDYEFEQRFGMMKFYGGAELLTKTKLILESIEQSYCHKELLTFNNLTIEHIMPQTISDAWKHELGDDWEETHEIYLHNIGNLTLTGYNSELSNKPYSEKLNNLLSSHLEINLNLSNYPKWTKESILTRSKELYNICNTIWPYFGSDNILSNEDNSTTKSPNYVNILNQQVPVSSWRDVFYHTLETIQSIEPQLIPKLESEFPRYINRIGDFRFKRKLPDDYYVNVDLSAQNVIRLCLKMMNFIGLSEDDWYVDYE